MRQFAKDNDVIHVTIDRQSLAQLTNLSERDIKRDENVKLVTNRDEMPEQMFKDEGESSHVKTMYGTFNNQGVQANADSGTNLSRNQTLAKVASL